MQSSSESDSDDNEFNFEDMDIFEDKNERKPTGKFNIFISNLK